MKRKFLRSMACAMSVCMLSMSLAGCGNDAAESSAPESSSPEDSTQDSSEPVESEESNANDAQQEVDPDAYVNPNGDLYPAYDFGGIELTVLAHNNLADLVPEGEGLEDYQIADRQKKKDYIEKKYNV